MKHSPKVYKQRSKNAREYLDSYNKGASPKELRSIKNKGAAKTNALKKKMGGDHDADLKRIERRGDTKHRNRQIEKDKKFGIYH